MKYLDFRYTNTSLYPRKIRNKDNISLQHKASIAKCDLAKAVLNDVIRPISFIPSNIGRQVVRDLKKH